MNPIQKVLSLLIVILIIINLKQKEISITQSNSHLSSGLLPEITITAKKIDSQRVQSKSRAINPDSSYRVRAKIKGQVLTRREKKPLSGVILGASRMDCTIYQQGLVVGLHDEDFVVRDTTDSQGRFEINISIDTARYPNMIIIGLREKFEDYDATFQFPGGVLLTGDTPTYDNYRIELARHQDFEDPTPCNDKSHREAGVLPAPKKQSWNEAEIKRRMSWAPVFQFDSMTVTSVEEKITRKVPRYLSVRNVPSNGYSKPTEIKSGLQYWFNMTRLATGGTKKECPILHSKHLFAAQSTLIQTYAQWNVGAGYPANQHFAHRDIDVNDVNDRYLLEGALMAEGATIVGANPLGENYHEPIFAAFSARCGGTKTLSSRYGMWSQKRQGGPEISYLQSVQCTGHCKCKVIGERCRRTRSGVWIYGHGVGGCQRGMSELAQNGLGQKKYPWEWWQIATHYYTGIALLTQQA